MAFDLFGKPVFCFGIVRSEMDNENPLSRLILFNSDSTNPFLLKQVRGVPPLDRSQLVFLGHLLLLAIRLQASVTLSAVNTSSI